MTRKIDAPLSAETVRMLRAGDIVNISGIVYTARDAAHKRMMEMLDSGLELPFDIRGQVIYYTGPCPPRTGMVIGSAGPTTSGRMDAYTPRLIELGLAGMIGKGTRSAEVVESMVRYGAVYFGATGGAGALIARSVTGSELVAFPELGTEAVRRLTIRDFPAIVVIDCFGGDLYASGKEKYTK